MPLQTPDTPKEVIEDAKTDVQRSAPSTNPFLPNSSMGAMVSAFGNRLFDNYQNVNDAVDAAFYDTSPEDFLLRQAGWYGIIRNPESQGSGSVAFSGINGTVILTGQEILTSDDLTIITDEDITILFQQVNPASVTPNGSIAIVTTVDPHNLPNNIDVTISGADPVTQGDIYNGTFSVSVTGTNTFTYEMSTSTADVPAGTIFASFTSGFGASTSESFGADTNLEPLTRLTVSPVVAGADTFAFVTADGFSGGEDEETIEALRIRLLFRVANPTANFNEAAIEAKAFEIAGVTRVFVQETTPALGQVTILFLRDNDVDPIPNASEILDVKTNILTIKPANTSDVDVIVVAPTAVVTDFDFASIDPNTDTMKDSVQQQLGDFFATSAELSTPVKEDAYKTAIFNTIDTVTGDTVSDFELTSPVGDISVGSDQIATLGEVVFP